MNNQEHIDKLEKTKNDLIEGGHGNFTIIDVIEEIISDLLAEVNKCKTEFPLHKGIEVEYNVIEKLSKEYLNSLKEQNQNINTFNSYDFMAGFHYGVDWLSKQSKESP